MRVSYDTIHHRWGLALAGLVLGAMPTAHAGCLDWLFGRSQTTAYNLPVTPIAPTNGVLLGDGGCGYNVATNVARVPTVAVPCTNYQTVAQRVPVSTYRPNALGQVFGCRGSEVQAARVPVGYQQVASPAVGLQQVGTILVPVGGAMPTCAAPDPCSTGMVAAQRPIAAWQALRLPASPMGGCATCATGMPALPGGYATVPTQSAYPGYSSADMMPTLSGLPMGGAMGGTTVGRPALPGGWVPTGDPSTCATCNLGAPGNLGAAGGGDPSGAIVSRRIVPSEEAATGASQPSPWRTVTEGSASSGSGLSGNPIGSGVSPSDYASSPGASSRGFDPAEQRPTLRPYDEGAAAGGYVERPASGDVYAGSDSRLLSRPSVRMAPEGTTSPAPETSYTAPTRSPGPSYYGDSAVGSGVVGSGVVGSGVVGSGAIGSGAIGSGAAGSDRAYRVPADTGYSGSDYAAPGYTSPGYSSPTASSPSSGGAGCVGCDRTNTGFRPEVDPADFDESMRSRIVDRRSTRQADRTASPVEEIGSARMTLSGLVRPPADSLSETGGSNQAGGWSNEAERITTRRPAVSSPADRAWEAGIAPTPTRLQPNRSGPADDRPDFDGLTNDRLTPSRWSPAEQDRLAARRHDTVPSLLEPPTTRPMTRLGGHDPIRTVAALATDELPSLGGRPYREASTRSDIPPRHTAAAGSFRSASSHQEPATAPRSRFDDSGWGSDR